MRISSTLFFQTGLNSINAQQSDLMHLFQQIGSGQRMVTPADDPLAAAQAINISQSQTMNMRYADNREVAKRNLGVEENTLNSVTTLLQDVKTRLVEAGNGTLSDVDRMTLSGVLKHARTTLLGLANATDGNGQYLFSGSLGDVEPFDADGIYRGDTGKRNVQVDQTRRLPASDVGVDIFARATPGINSYITAAGTGTSLGGMSPNSGTGVISSASIHDASALNPDYRFEITIDDAAAGTYTVTVYDMSIEADPAVDFDADPDAAVVGRHDSLTFVPGKDNEIRLPHGVQVKLAGNPADGDTFRVDPAAGHDLNIFQTLDAVIKALETPIDADPVAAANLHNTLASSVQRLDINYDNVLTVRASVGARLNEIEALDANGDLRNLSYRSQLSKLEDLDYYTATTQLELRKSALEAAALAFRKIQGTSLFNMGGN